MMMKIKEILLMAMVGMAIGCTYSCKQQNTNTGLNM